MRRLQWTLHTIVITLKLVRLPRVYWTNSRPHALPHTGQRVGGETRVPFLYLWL
jgi:hypothetical protein